MALLDFVKPKWQHSDPRVRLEAVRNLHSDDTEILLSLIKEDPDHDVRSAAISRIDNINTLSSLERQNLDEQISAVLESRLNSLRTEQILTSDTSAIGPDKLILPSDMQLLARIAIESENPDTRIVAIHKIDDQHLLGEILMQRSGNDPARIAIDKIDDLEILKNLSAKASGKTARRLAQEKLSAIEAEQNKPSPEELRDLKLAELCDAAELLAASSSFADGPAQIDQLKQGWLSLDADGSNPLKSRFDTACEDFERNLADFNKRCEEEKRKAELYAGRFSEYDSICESAEKLAKSTDADAEAQLQELQNKWLSLQQDARIVLPPTAVLQARFDDACKAFIYSREKVTAEKKILADLEKECSQCEKQLRENKTQKLAENIQELQEKISRTNLHLVDIKPLKQRLVEIKKSLEELAAAKHAAKEQANQENIDKRTSICTEIEKLIDADKKIAAEKKAKQLLDEWEKLPQLSGPEGKTLEKRFQEALTKFNEEQKKFFHEQEWQQWANKTKKEELILAAQTLENEDDLGLVAELVKELQTQWKAIGPAPRDVSQKLWDKFHSLCDKNFTRCQPYFEELEVKRQENIQTLEKFCEEAEALMDSEEWQATADKLKKLQADWKATKPVPRRKADKLFARFRKACNVFFDRRHENYQEGDKVRRENLKEKEALCLEAEQLSEQPHWDDSAKYRQLQSRWKKIGHVPKESEDTVWTRFRAACDKFFNWLDEQRLQNLKRKEELCSEVEQILANLNESDTSALRESSEKLNELQHQWKEIGPVPREQKDTIWERFHTPCDKFFELRRQQFEEQDKLRRGNLEKKEAILAKAEEIASSGAGKEIAEELKKLQEEWREIGPAPRDHDAELNNNFKACCDSFFEGRRQYFEDIKKERLENLKKKEALCVRLENIVGHSGSQSNAPQSKALSLAEQLKLAMEENAIMAGHLDDRASQLEELKRIQDEWKKIGSVPRQHDQLVWKRYKGALDIFYSKERNKKDSDQAG